MKYSHVYFEDRYTLSENSYLMAADGDMATMMCLSNGYMGVRGSLEEDGTLGVQGTYIRGVIDTAPCAPMPVIDNEYMKKYYFNEEAIKRFEKNDAFINIADILLLRFSVNGETFYPWDGTILEWKRSLDMKGNKLVRTVLWENSKGERTRFVFERFASYADDNLFAIKVSITPENYDGEIEVLSGIDGLTKSMGGCGGGYLLGLDKQYSTNGSQCFYTYVTGEKYQIQVAVGTDTKIADETGEQNPAWLDGEKKDAASVKTTVVVKKGKTYTAEKAVYLITSRDTESKPIDVVAEKIKTFKGYAKELELHVAEWSKVFAKIDIEIEGDVEADTGLRFSNFQTIGSFNRNDAVHSLGAKGLTGPNYGGLVWWDCEVYQSPVFYMTMPEQAKNLLLYRYNKLEAAKKNAIEEGYKGARYPFNSGVTGEENLWPVARHPFMQIHVVSDVAWSICNYYNCSGDDEFMVQYGMEMLYEICKYWLSRVEKDERGYVINQVTGTDEHHPYVDNNAYTNYVVHYMAKRTLELTEQYGEQLSSVREKTDATDAFIKEIEDLVANIYLPMEKKTGMIPQFDDYFGLSRDLEVVGGNQAKAFQMKASGLYHKSQVIKQPDVLVLFAYQNMEFPALVYKRNWDYYRARCEASSSLSYSVHSICASDMDEPESAYTYFMQTAMMDLNDEHHCAHQGIHSACAAGAWMAIVRGVGGTVLREDKVEINPHMIPWWESVKYSVMWHGQRILVTLQNDEVCITSSQENKKEVPLVVYKESCMMQPGETIRKKLVLE